MDSLSLLDIFTLVVVGALAVRGVLRGFVTEVLSLMAWVAAVIALNLFYAAGKQIAAGFVGSELAAAALAFGAIFLGVYLAFRFVATQLGNRTKRSIVGPIDRVLGLGFGALKGLIIVSLAFLVFTRGYALLFGGNEKLPDFVREAHTAPLLDMTSRAIIDYAEERQEGSGLGDDGREAIDPAGKDVPLGADDEGYTEDDRGALDDLIGESGGTEI
jgi:membrane protein required for colicin V production